MQIGARRRRTVIPHLKPILNTSKLKIEIQIEMRWYIFQCSTVAENCNTETLVEMRDGTVDHFPSAAVVVPERCPAAGPVCVIGAAIVFLLELLLPDVTR